MIHPLQGGKLKAVAFAHVLGVVVQCSSLSSPYPGIIATVIPEDSSFPFALCRPRSRLTDSRASPSTRLGARAVLQGDLTSSKPAGSRSLTACAAAAASAWTWTMSSRGRRFVPFFPESQLVTALGQGGAGIDPCTGQGAQSDTFRAGKVPSLSLLLWMDLARYCHLGLGLGLGLGTDLTSGPRQLSFLAAVSTRWGHDQE